MYESFKFLNFKDHYKMWQSNHSTLNDKPRWPLHWAGIPDSPLKNKSHFVTKWWDITRLLGVKTWI